MKEEEVKEEEIQPEQQPSQPKPSQTPSRSSLPQSRSIKKKEMRNGEYLWILLTRLILSDSLPISIQVYSSLSLMIIIRLNLQSFSVSVVFIVTIILKIQFLIIFLSFYNSLIFYLISLLNKSSTLLHSIFSYFVTVAYSYSLHS